MPINSYPEDEVVQRGRALYEQQTRAACHICSRSAMREAAEGVSSLSKPMLPWRATMPIGGIPSKPEPSSAVRDRW